MIKVQEYLPIAVKAAQLSGTYLLKSMANSQTVESDIAHDLKLKVDRMAERRIVQYLKKYTSFSILSEEIGFLKGEKNEFCWVVDPLDGTINYFHQVPLSCVSIALCYQQKPVLGVIYDFTRKEMFTGIVNKGAYLNGRRIRVSNIKEHRQAVVSTGFPSRMNLKTESFKKFIYYVRTYKKVRLLGTAALSMAYVACGRLDAYFEKDIMLWDVAAGAVLVQAAGGKVDLRLNKDSFKCQIMADNRSLTTKE